MNNKKVLIHNIVFLIQVFTSIVVLFTNNAIAKNLLLFSTIYMFLWFICNVKVKTYTTTKKQHKYNKI